MKEEKQYAIKIESSDHGLLFHFVFSEEEAKKAKISIGNVALIINSGMEGEEVNIQCKSISILGLYNWVNKFDSDR